MTNLSAAKALTSKMKWPVVVAIVAIFFTTLILLRYFSPAGEKVDLVEPPQIPKTSFEAGLDLSSLKNVDSPKTLPVYNLSQVNLQDLSSPIAQKLGFTEKPIILEDANLGAGKVYSAKNATLSIYKNDLTFEKYIKPQAGEVDEKDLKNKSTSFISSLGLGIDFSPEIEVRYYKLLDEFLFEVANNQEADIIKLIFTYEKNGFPTITSRGETAVFYNKNGELLKLNHHSFAAGKELGQYTLITGSEAVGQIMAGAGQVLKLNQKDDLTPIPQKVKVVKIEKNYLAYLVPQEGETIQPVWIFAGSFQTSEGTVEATYFVPAISKKLLK